MGVGTIRLHSMIGIVHWRRRYATVMVGVLEGMKVVGLDLETTGFDSRSERIVEYALVGSDSDGSHIGLCSLVDPGRRIPPDSTAVHGITNEDVRDSGEFSEHTDAFSKIVEGAIVVGHNVMGFDWGFVHMEYLRAGLEVPKVRGFIDTLKLARKLQNKGVNQNNIVLKEEDFQMESLLKVKDKIDNIDLDTITPLEALNILHKLKSYN